MTRPGEFDDVNEAVGSEWEDGTTPFERVHDVISRAYSPVSADSVADIARTSTETARKHLDILDDEGFIVTETGDDGTKTYRRSPQSLVVEQAVDIIDNTSTDELAVQVAEMRDRVSEFQTEHEDSEDKREWQTTRRNLAVANVALAIDEAVEVVDGEFERRRRAALEGTRRMFETKDYDAHTDIGGSPADPVNEDELQSEIEVLERELADRVDKD